MLFIDLVEASDGVQKNLTVLIRATKGNATLLDCHLFPPVGRLLGNLCPFSQEVGGILVMGQFKPSNTAQILSRWSKIRHLEFQPVGKFEGLS